MKQTFWLLLLMLFPISQNSEVRKQKEIQKINNRALRWFKKTDCYVSGKYVFINWLYVEYKGNYHYRKEIVNRLEEKIEPIYPHYDKKHWENRTYICNGDGLIVASTEYRNIYCMSHYNEYVFETEQQLVNMLREKDIHKVYSFYPMDLFSCLGVDNNKVVYFFHVVDGVYKATKVEELSDEEWDEVLSPIDSM